METLKTKLQAVEEAKAVQALQIPSLKNALSQEINDLKITNVDLENQVQVLTSRLFDAEQQLSQQQQRNRSVSPPPSPRRASTPRPFSPFNQGIPVAATTSTSSLYNVVRDSGSTFQIEEMQSQIKQKDGEICQLQTDIMNLELTRESMANELVDLANENSKLEERVKNYPSMKKQYNDMEERYNAILQMYGEKVEEYDELTVELQHVKSMYKTQIDELVQKTTWSR